MAGDAAIAAAIERRIASDDELGGVRIQVRVVDGVATLEGVAGSADEVRRALRHAARVDGVRQVVNRILVVGSGAVSRAASGPVPQTGLGLSRAP